MLVDVMGTRHYILIKTNGKILGKRTGKIAGNVTDQTAPASFKFAIDAECENMNDEIIEGAVGLKSFARSTQDDTTGL